jgi:ABC-type Zn uptake system ZnuABC Zn-binding protein ZnuA
VVELAGVTSAPPSERNPAEDGHEHGAEGGHEHEGEHDPHWWHDPRNAVAAVREVERALSDAAPADRALFARNADAYIARLRALDAGIARCMEAIPPSRRRIVTDHDAFGPFAERYGIEVVGSVIPAQTTEAQPSAKDLHELIEVIEARGVVAVLPESSLSSGAAQAVARQTGATARYSLYGDSLGPERSAGETYLGMLGANADAVVRAITDGRRGCDPLP